MFSTVMAGAEPIELKDIINQIDLSIRYLQTCEDYSREMAFQHICYLEGNTTPSAYPPDDLAVLIKHIGSSELTAIFPRMWNSLFVDKAESTHGFLSDKLPKMLLLFVHLTCTSVQCCMAFSKGGGIQLMVRGLERIKEVWVPNEQLHKTLRRVFMITHNVIHLCPSNIAYFRSSNATHILKQYLELDTIWQVLSLMVLAYVATDSEKKELASAQAGVKILIEIYKLAVISPRHIAQVGTMQFSACEMLDALNQLAINDDVKYAIVKEEALRPIAEMLHGDSPEEQKLGAEALWNLAFIESIRQDNVLQQTIQTLEILIQSENKEVRGACASALFQIQGGVTTRTSHLRNSPPPSYQEALSEPSRSSTNRKVQVMISYQWDSQERAKQIRDNLTADGYRVWMDVTNMRGDMLSAMADAIQTSHVILICMTERYKDSQNCRSEAAFAFKLKKKIIPLLLQRDYTPDGWLGLLQGMDLYYSFHSKDHLDKSMGELLKAIGEQAGNDEADGTLRQSIENLLVTSPPFRAPPAVKQPAAAEWSKEDVQRWLKEQDLKQLCKKLKKFNGTHLEEMYSSLCKNEDKFKDELKSDYGMKADVRTQFVVALKAAFKE